MENRDHRLENTEEIEFNLNMTRNVHTKTCRGFKEVHGERIYPCNP